MTNSMVKWTAILFAAGACSLSGAESQAKPGRPESVIRWQFAGTQNLLSNKDTSKNLRELLSLPQTDALRDAAVDRWAKLAASRTTRDAAAAEASAQLIRPLLLDAVQQESRLEVSGLDGKADWALAVRLPAERVAVWSTNLWQWAKASHVGEPTAAKGGWAAESGNYRVAFSTDKNWVLLQGGHSPQAAQAKSLAAFTKTLRRKSSDVLKAAVDLGAMGRLAHGGDAHHAAHAPKFALKVSPSKEGLRSEMLLEYPEDLQIKPETWDIPLSTIREPLIGFTAIQGVERFLSRHDWIKSAGFEKMPNQLFSWSQGISLFSVSLAAKVGNPAVAMDRIAQGMLGTSGPGLIGASGGQLLYLTNDHRLVWRGLPVVVPFAAPAAAPDNEFLVAGLFPTNQRETNGLPAELLKQVQKPGLIYYDWEITQARLSQWRPIWQLTRIARGLLLADKAPSEAWLEVVGAKLGNTITEATLPKRNQIKVVRRSDSGFSALELAFLAHWLDGSNDPASRPAPRSPRGNAPRKAPGPGKAPTPAPAPPGL
jgi:hypothetical protein